MRIHRESGAEGSWQEQARRHEWGDLATTCSASISMIIWPVRPAVSSWHAGWRDHTAARQPVTYERNRRGATDAQLKAVMKSANQPPGGWAGRQVGEEKGR